MSAGDKAWVRRLLPVWLPAVAYMALIWFLSSGPVNISFEDVPLKDKGVHFIEYAALAVLSARAIARTWPAVGLLRVTLWAALLTATWGYLDELHQAFVPTRDSSALDFLADAIGGTIGVAAFAGVFWLRRAFARQERG